MSYSAEISRTSPTAFLFLVDQSGSMQEAMENGKSKAQFVADVLNRTLATLITRCTKSEGTRDYFEVGVLGYSGAVAENGLSGALSTVILHPISRIEAHPLRVEDRTKRVDDGAGGLVNQTIKFPVWFEPKAAGGTPMCNAITTAAEQLAAWCDAHPDCYPPTVLHVTDGESTDGDPEALALQLQRIGTNDGQVLLFNLHVSITAVIRSNSPLRTLASATATPSCCSACPARCPHICRRRPRRRASGPRWNRVASCSMPKLPRSWTSLTSVPGPPSCAEYGPAHPLRRNGGQAHRFPRGQ